MPRNLVFVIWLLFFPLFQSVEDYLSYLKGRRFSNDAEIGAGLIMLAFYIWIATLLYEKRKKSEKFIEEDERKLTRD